MRFTEYGMRLADQERPVDNRPWLTSGEEYARESLLITNREKLILLTGGQDTEAGRRLRLTVYSCIAAFAYAETNPSIKFAWHLLPDGSRRLVFRS